MKKFLPLVLIAAGFLVFVSVFFRMRGSRDQTIVEKDEDQVAEIPFDKRPFTSLTPTSDGHWLNLKIEKINIPNATSVDYELLYEVPGKPNQGTGGNAKISSETFEQKLLLGSESSGKYRYDEGVAKGVLTLRFRNDKGKLVGKLSTPFHLQSKTAQLTSIDEKFRFVLTSAAAKTFFVTMNTFGITAPVSSSVKEGPYAVFSSDSAKYLGTPEMSGGQINIIEGSKITPVGDSTLIGVFVVL